MTGYSIDIARKNELDVALGLVFQHLGGAEAERRRQRAREMLAAGHLDPGGVLVARRGADILGAVVCTPLAGASGLFWLPQTAAGADAHIGRKLVRVGLDWLTSRGAKLAQALVAPEEWPFAKPLLDEGFQHPGRLHYLRHDLEFVADPTFTVPGLSWQDYTKADRCLYHETLLRSYEGTLDCPELNDRRTLDDIVQGHRHQGTYRPELWWLASVQKEAAGVVIVADLPDEQAWDLAYMGVVPKFRGRGLGRTLVERVLRRARRAQVRQLISAVDARNAPARQLYAKTGFREVDAREILLFFIPGLVAKDRSS